MIAESNNRHIPSWKTWTEELLKINKMKKYFLIFIFLPFFASSQVTIPDEVARFFLERNERVKILEKENETLHLLLVNLEKKVAIKDTIISTYVNDQTTYMNIIEATRWQVKVNESYIEDLKKEIRKERRRKNFWKVATPVCLLLSLII